MSRKRETACPRKINGYWYLVRRVPIEFRHVETRRLIMLSTRIRVADDPRGIRAQSVVSQLDAELLRYWRDAKSGNLTEARKRYLKAQDTARSFGCDYVDAMMLKTQFGEFMRRMLILSAVPEGDLPAIAPALLGEIPTAKTGRKVADMLEAYEAILAASLMKKSPGQLRRWRTTRQRALTVFVEIVGENKLMADLTQDDAYSLRDHWNKRVLTKEILIDTANKQIGYVAAMFREINDFERLKLEDIFARKTIRGGQKRQRAAFSIEHVQDVLLAPGALDGLNNEARAIFYVVAELGLRPSEVCGLRRAHIHLDTEIPYISVSEDGRQVKTMNSIRNTPLVGVALDAMKHFPDGFPRYLDKNDVLSATVNKYLVENNLLQRPGQSFYSLRHTFKDRLRRLPHLKQELLDKLMGHATSTEPYGEGYELKQKREALQAIMFKAPPVSFAQQASAPGSEHRLSRAKRALLQEPGTAT